MPFVEVGAGFCKIRRSRSKGNPYLIKRVITAKAGRSCSTPGVDVDGGLVGGELDEVRLGRCGEQRVVRVAEAGALVPVPQHAEVVAGVVHGHDEADPVETDDGELSPPEVLGGAVLAVAVAALDVGALLPLVPPALGPPVLLLDVLALLAGERRGDRRLGAAEGQALGPVDCAGS